MVTVTQTSHINWHEKRNNISMEKNPNTQQEISIPHIFWHTPKTTLLSNTYMFLHPLPNPSSTLKTINTLYMKAYIARPVFES